MKNILILGLTFLVLATMSGCGGLYGRGAMGGYGTMGSGYSSMPYGAGSAPMMGGAMAGAPMTGMPVGTGGLPIGARGALSPYGGSVYAGTGYTNPELTMMAAGRRADWARASASVPVTPMTTSPCSDGSCPIPEVEAPAADLEARIEAVEDQLLADHGVPR